jgi:calcineurin-like phosphoesterase family protein
VKLAENWRPWAGGTVESHNETIRRRINDRVAPDDELWIIGDACMGVLTESLAFMRTINGRKILVPGNHDRCSEAYDAKPAKREKYIQMYSEVFTIADPLVAGEGVIFCHYPWRGTDDHADREIIERYGPSRDEWPNTILVHGHTHAAEKFGEMSIHVGIDAWPDGPIPMGDILALAAAMRA